MIKILHLEDDKRDAEQIQWMLKKSNIEFEVRLVDTRAEYQRALKEFKPQVVISDHSLPAFNSLEALALLRNSQLSIPFILVTGAVSEEFAVDAMRQGADDYILKDRPQRLALAVEAALEKYRLQHEQIRKDAMLRNIDENSLDVICTLDGKARFLHVSAASLSVWGYHPFELLGKSALDLVFAPDLEMTKKETASIIAGNAVTGFENRHVRKDGAIVPMLWSAKWDEDDKTIYCIGKDTTEKKRAEAAFRNEQQRFVDLFLEAPASIAILKGPRHIYQMLNPGHKAFIGKDGIIGKTVAEVSPELESQGLTKMLDTVYHTGKSFSAKEMRFKITGDGRETKTDVYCSFVLQPIRDLKGDVEGIFFFGLDVTEEVKARRRIQESEDQYIQLLENLPVAVYTCDSDGRILLYNKAAAALWGREPRIGTVWCGSCQIYDKEEKPISPASSPIARAFKEGRSSKEEEIIIARQDGTRRHVIPHPAVSFNDSGVMTGAINVLIDITERKTAETETLKLVDRLKLKNKELQQFAYMVSHNLRSPIARILGLASLWRSDEEENKMLIEKITEETLNLDGVVKDMNVILSARHSEEEKREIVIFQDKLSLILKVLEKEIMETNACITADFTAVQQMITIKGYLHSIIYNLMSNALKYRLPSVPLAIYLKTSQNKNFICLSVKDNGRGIDLEKNGSKIFGLYKRFHGDQIPGKGLGLHLVRTHVQSLGGKVEVISKINKGTEFKIYFPETYELPTD